MKALADVVTDTTKSENVRKFALQEMKGIDEARFGRYDVEKGKLAGLTQSVNAYTQSIIANSVAQKLSDRASDALIARNTQLNLYENQYKALEDIEKKYPGVSKRSEDYKKQVEQTAKLGGIPTPIKEDVELYNQAIGKLKEYKTTLNEVNKTYLSTRKEARGATDEAIKFGSALVDLKDDTSNTKNIFAPKIDVQDVDEFTNIDKVIQRVTKYGDAFIDINNSVAERSEALKKLLEVDPQYFKSFNVASKDVDTAREAIEQLIRTLNSNKLFEQQRVEGQKLNNLWEKQARDRKEALEKTQEAADNEFIERANQNNTFNYKAKLEFTAFDADLEKAVGTVNSAFKSLEDVFNDVFENIVSKNQQIANSIEGYITQPMQTLFDILTNEGEASWKDFGKVVIDVLKKIAIQAISTAIAKTLANILAPGFGSISTPSLLDYLDNPPGDFDLNMLTGGGRRRGSNSSANFGGIVGSQSMQMAGQVNMVIRGSDLVGVMNRTNTTINRVG